MLGRVSRRGVAGGAGVGAALSVGLSLAAMPIGAVARARAMHVGLVTQSWSGWGGDQVKALAIGVVLAGAGGAIAVALMRRLPRGWWAPGAAGVVAVGALFLFVGPVVLDPLFNRFTPLARGPVRSEVLALARRAGVKVGQVYEVDASKRTTAANAYVTGLGSSKRVVIYDTLLRDFTPAETRLVVAHELGHVHYRDVPRGLLFLALVAPFGVLAVQRLSWALSSERGNAAALPAVVLALGLVATPVGWISNQLSRRVEARADSFALRLTGEPRPYIEFQRRIAAQNVDDVTPPRWLSDVLDTHPPALDRIGAALAYERGAR
jgi:STE24 endopeptidase